MDKDCPKIFLEISTLDTSRSIHVVEDSFDSLFIENCIAVAQSDLRVPKYKEKVVLIPDNEPRNKQVCKQIEQWSRMDTVLYYLADVKEKRSINDMILSDILIEIQELIHNNTHKSYRHKPLSVRETDIETIGENKIDLENVVNFPSAEESGLSH